MPKRRHSTLLGRCAVQEHHDDRFCTFRGRSLEGRIEVTSSPDSERLNVNAEDFPGGLGLTVFRIDVIGIPEYGHPRNRRCRLLQKLKPFGGQFRRRERHSGDVSTGLRQARYELRHLVYPVAESAGLGVHVTLDLGGRAKFGPDVQWIDTINYTFDDSRRALFCEAMRRYYPELDASLLQPDYTGIRPKICGPGEPAADFRIDGPEVHGVPGLVNLPGIELPGLTAALAIAIAEHVRDAHDNVQRPTRVATQATPPRGPRHCFPRSRGVKRSLGVERVTS